MTHNKLPIDERCYCGHTRGQHNDTIAAGHGSCQKCFCVKFTWASFIYQSKEVKKEAWESSVEEPTRSRNPQSQGPSPERLAEIKHEMQFIDPDADDRLG